jgi:selenocysteine lyase/cysteine desulfurase
VRFETGTPSFEGQAGVIGTIEYLEWLGTELGDSGNSRRSRLCTAMTACEKYERQLGERLLAGLYSIEGLKLWGPPSMEGRVPTLSFTMEGRTPTRSPSHLAARGVFAWSGNFYAVEVIARLGLEKSGGLLRVGLCHYSTRRGRSAVGSDQGYRCRLASRNSIPTEAFR